MSVHLLSRRSLLRSVVVVGAAFLLGRSTLADSPGRDGTWWALGADTHIDPSAEVSEGGGNMDERFKLVVKDILASEQPITGLIVDGDLAHSSGRREAYTRLLGLAYPIQRAGIEIHWLLGNHDNREHFLDAAYANRRPKLPVPDYYARVIERGGVRWFLLDSLNHPGRPQEEQGVEQLTWLKRELDADRKTPAIVVVHHNIQENGGSMTNGKPLFDLICASRQVKAVFQGHNHTYETVEIEGVHFIKLPGVGYALGEGKPIGWVRAYVDAAGCELELRAVDGDKKLNGMKRKLTWR